MSKQSSVELYFVSQQDFVSHFPFNWICVNDNCFPRLINIFQLYSKDPDTLIVYGNLTLIRYIYYYLFMIKPISTLTIEESAFVNRIGVFETFVQALSRYKNITSRLLFHYKYGIVSNLQRKLDRTYSYRNV